MRAQPLCHSGKHFRRGRSQGTVYLGRLSSFAAKQKLLRRLNHHYTVNEVAKSSLEALLVQAAKFNSQRNACVHAIWTAGGKDKLGQLNESQSHMVKHSHFKIVEVHEILALVEELSLFSGSLEEWRLRGQGMFGGWSEH